MIMKTIGFRGTLFSDKPIFPFLIPVEGTSYWDIGRVKVRGLTEDFSQVTLIQFCCHSLLSC